MSDGKKFVEKIEQSLLAKADGKKYIFRGTKEVFPAKGAGRISSVIYRNYDEIFAHIESRYIAPVEIEKEVVDKARRRFPQHYSNIGILTELRHFEAETTLIDFSESLYVALFFACDGVFDEKAELIIVDKDTMEEVDEIHYDNIRRARIAGNPALLGKAAIIRPRAMQHAHERVAAQSSIFVHAPLGYIEEKHVRLVEIKKEYKKAILELLDRCHNINRDTMFPDLFGFIANDKNFESAQQDFYTAFAQEKQGHYEEAIHHYSEAIEKDPKFAAAYNNRGNAKSASGDHAGAIEDYSRAIDIEPKFAVAYTNRGAAKDELKKYAAAIEDYSRAIAIEPKDAVAYYNRGNAKAQQERYSEAIEDYSKAIAIDLNYVAAYYNRGNAKRASGDPAGAIKDYDEAIKKDSDYAKAYCNRGVAKYKLKKYAEAIADCDEAIAINPNYAMAYNARGLAQDARKEYAAAIEDYSKAIEKDPKFAAAYNNRGATKYNLKKYAEAIEDYDRAIAISKSAAVYSNRGESKIALKKYAEAIEDCSRAIAIDPKFAEAYYNRGTAKQASGDPAGAQEDFETARRLEQGLE